MEELLGAAQLACGHWTFRAKGHGDNQGQQSHRGTHQAKRGRFQGGYSRGSYQGRGSGYQEGYQGSGGYQGGYQGSGYQGGGYQGSGQSSQGQGHGGQGAGSGGAQGGPRAYGFRGFRGHRGRGAGGGRGEAPRRDRIELGPKAVAWYQANGRCLKCGQSGHVKANCLNRWTKCPDLPRSEDDCRAVPWGESPLEVSTLEVDEASSSAPVTLSGPRLTSRGRYVVAVKPPLPAPVQCLAGPVTQSGQATQVQVTSQQGGDHVMSDDDMIDIDLGASTAEAVKGGPVTLPSTESALVGGQVTPSPPHQPAAAAANQNRRVTSATLARIRKLLPQGHSFTMEACTDNSGSNCVLGPGVARCSLDSSFLSADLKGHHIWLNPPFSAVTPFIDHYLEQKRLHPEISCVLVLPDLSVGNALVSEWTLLHTFPRSSKVFAAPDKKGHFRPMRPCPFPVKVWYDPPVVSAPTLSPLSDLHSNCPTFVLPGKLNSTAAEVGIATQRILLDSGATACFVSTNWLEQHIPYRLKKLRNLPDQATTVTLADGSQQPVRGWLRLSLSLGQYRGSVKVYVTDLQSYDLILGDNWLTAHRAYLDFDSKSLVIRQGNHRIVVQPRKPVLEEPAGVPAVTSEGLSMMSYKQVRRAVRKGGQLSVILVKKSPDSTLQLNAVQLETLADVQSYISKLGDPELVDFCRTHQDRFVPPPGYEATERPFTVDHTIRTAPGEQPHYKYTSRLTPKEKEELHRQIQELLEKGLIEPSVSPFGAPVIFVKKKDGSLRLCIDYRALNQITVRNPYPLPRIDELIDKLAHAKYFTSLDLASGYHQIRIEKEDVPKTAFSTPFGHFQWRVLIEGLTNAPATFQSLMDRIFSGHFRDFLCVYLDDILIFSKTRQEHFEHLQQVFDKLKEASLFCKLPKCDFLKSEVKFLGHVVSSQGVAPDPAKLEAVKEWKAPTSVHELQSFLGFANFFRRFIKGYSGLAWPLTDMTSKSKPYLWNPKAQLSFDYLKRALMSAPVLSIYDPEKDTEVVVDASKKALGAVLLQDGHPVAYESRKLSPAESRYDTGNRELLAVIHAVTTWRHYLEGVSFKLLTDHEPNTFFKALNPFNDRQARWYQKLARFTFTWVYKKGVENCADALSRIPGLEVDDNLVEEIALHVLTRSRTRGAQLEGGDFGPNKELPLPPPEDTIPELTPAPSGQTLASEEAPASTSSDPEPAAEQLWLSKILSRGQLVKAYSSREWSEERELAGTYEKGSGSNSDLWFSQGKIVVPTHSRFQALRNHIISEHHDAPFAGHQGVSRTKEALSRLFWWKGLHRDVCKYIQGCHQCAISKHARQRPFGLLQPLPAPDYCWQEITMDFVTGLPVTLEGYDTIVTFVDRFSKMVHFYPCTTDKLTAEKLADLFCSEVFRHHGTPAKIISDRDPKMVNTWWKEVMARMGSKLGVSTAFHPMTDGQSEVFNRTLEEILRCFVSPDMTNWAQLLPFVEFACNSHMHEVTRETPFFLNYGRQPARPIDLTFKAFHKSSNVAKARKAQASAREWHKALRRTSQLLEDNASRLAQRENVKRKDHTFREGDLVWLSARNFSWKHGAKRLCPRYMGPFKLLRAVGPVAFAVELPREWRTHNVFHVSLFRPVSPLLRFRYPTPVKVVDGVPEWEVKQILAHRKPKRRRVEYLIAWEGFGPEWNSWVKEDMMEGSPELLQEYFAAKQLNPNWGTVQAPAEAVSDEMEED